MNPDNTSRSQTTNQPVGSFVGTRVAIVPYPALGDTTIYLRLAWLFSCAGAEVSFYSDLLFPARQYFPWVKVLPEREDELEQLASDFELVIACFEKYYYQKAWSPGHAVLENVAFVTAKKIARDSGLDGRGVVIGQRVVSGASRAFCLDSRASHSMVEWVDSYAKVVFGLEPYPMPSILDRPTSLNSGLVVIFPTTPQVRKNYWISGFRWVANSLRKRGWVVEFVCMPDERETMLKVLPGYHVKSFPDIKELMEYLAKASIVISNDSGGGHLASLIGLRTFTITRRQQLFTWRPGFTELNTVISPWFRFKTFSGNYVWRPFIPIWRLSALQVKDHAGS